MKNILRKLFTVAPPLALGLFDMPTKADTMLNFPDLYKITVQNAGFDMKVKINKLKNLNSL